MTKRKRLVITGERDGNDRGRQMAMTGKGVGNDGGWQLRRKRAGTDGIRELALTFVQHLLFRIWRM